MASKDSDDDKMKDPTNGSEDNFGLPDIEYKPLDQSKEKKTVQEDVAKNVSPEPEKRGSEGSGIPPSYESFSVDESKSRAPVILGVVIVLVLLIAGFLIYNFVWKPREVEKARKEQLAKEAEDKLKKDAADRQAKAEEEARIRKEEEALANAKPKIGSMELLSARTRRYYVVIGSAVDDDLLNDFARKLSAKGISTKMLPPFGGKKFYRLTIADLETFALAQAKADAAKPEYGKGLWVIRY